jgi:hypothetical protein
VCRYIMAGTVGPAAGWRLPFVLAAAPAILLAFLVYFTVEEPKRGAQEEAVKRRHARRRAEQREREGNLRESDDVNGRDKVGGGGGEGNGSAAALGAGAVGAGAGTTAGAVEAAGAGTSSAAAVLPGAAVNAQGLAAETTGAGEVAGDKNQDIGAKDQTKGPPGSGDDDAPDEYEAKIDMKKLWRQLQIPSNIIILAQGLPGGAAQVDKHSLKVPCFNP